MQQTGQRDNKDASYCSSSMPRSLSYEFIFPQQSAEMNVFSSRRVFSVLAEVLPHNENGLSYSSPRMNFRTSELNILKISD